MQPLKIFKISDSLSVIVSQETLDKLNESQNENTSPERLAELAKMNDNLAYLVANNVNTSPETLTQLGKSNNQEIIKAVVRNPNTPTKILIELGFDFPKELFKNPILDLWLLEDIHPLLFYRSFNKKFASNSQTPVSLLEILAKDSARYVRSEVAKNPNTPVSLQKILAYTYGDILSHIQNPNIPIAALEILAKDSDSEVRIEVAKNSNTPIAALEIIAKDSDSDVYKIALKRLKQHQTNS